MKKRNFDKLWVTLGFIGIALGIAAVLYGISNAAQNKAIYIGGNAAGAILILAGLTPVVLFFEERVGAQRKERLEKLKDGVSGAIGKVNWKEEKDTRWFPGPHTSVDAEIVGITRNLRARNNADVVYYVICKYKDPVTHSDHVFTSNPVQEYPGKDIIGKKVRIFFRSHDPEDYLVDLTTIHE